MPVTTRSLSRIIESESEQSYQMPEVVRTMPYALRSMSKTVPCVVTQVKPVRNIPYGLRSMASM
jgi:hypothetical protein